MESNGLELIKALPDDTQKLFEISRETFYEAFGPPVNTEDNIQAYLNENITIEKITDEILHPESQFFFATYQNQIVGYTKLNSGIAQTEKISGNAIEIERIYIIRSFQNKGLGKHVLSLIIEIATKKRVEFIWLGVWEKNKRAIKFYQEHNFKVFDKHKFTLGSEEQTDLMMKLVLA